MKSVLKAIAILISILLPESCDMSHDSGGGDLGLVITSPSLGVSLKFIDGKYPPVIALDSTSIPARHIENAVFYYVKSNDGFDNMPDPTVYDARLSSKGIVMDVQNSCDRLYVKVLGKCKGYRDTYIKVIVRNWMFDRNYIAPNALVSSYEGLDIVLDKNYQEATAELAQMVTYPRVGYVGMNEGSATVKAILGGHIWMYSNFFGGSFKDTMFSMYGPDESVYEITMPGAAYYYENSIKKSVLVGSVNKGEQLKFSWSFKLWMADVAVLEQQGYQTETNVPTGDDNIIEELQ